MLTVFYVPILSRRLGTDTPRQFDLLANGEKSCGTKLSDTVTARLSPCNLRFSSLPPMLECGFESRLGLGFPGCSGGMF